MKYVNLFKNHSEYSTSELKVNVSHCLLEDEIHYRHFEHDYSKDYLTIESLENDNNVFFASFVKTLTISASTDGGETWAEYVSSSDNNDGTLVATLSKGQKMLIKGENQKYYDEDEMLLAKLNITGNLNLYGNIMSLVRGDDFENEEPIEFNVSHLFSYLNGLQSAENLVLPSFTAPSCYFVQLEMNRQ